LNAEPMGAGGEELLSLGGMKDSLFLCLSKIDWKKDSAPAGYARQIVSGTILIAPHGHSDTQMPQPLQ
jgi:hypothetical protein